MNRSDSRFLNRSRLTTLVLVTGGLLGLLAGCTSDEGNPVPSGPPPITTGGGGGTGEAGESPGGAANNGGSSNRAGSANGGADGGSSPAAEGGEGGEAGTGPVLPACPATTDEGFLNAPSPATTIKSHFDNTRLGVHDSLPELPH